MVDKEHCSLCSLKGPWSAWAQRRLLSPVSSREPSAIAKTPVRTPPSLSSSIT